MRIRSVARTACLALVAPCLQAGAELPRIPGQAQIVHVDVVVTDKRGRLVAGLGPQDFELFDDGKAVSVVGFSAPGPAALAGGAPAAPSPGLPAGEPGPETTARDDSILLVVYVDNANLTMAGRRRLLAGVRAFLDSRPAAGRVLVLSSDERQARALSAVTTSRADIAAALRAAEEGPPQGQQLVSDERATLDVVKNVIDNTPGQALPPRKPCEVALPMLQNIVRAHADARRQQLQRAFERLTQTVAALGALPGPKALLYLSQGLDQRPGIQLFHQLGDICPEALHRDPSSLLAPMTEYDLSAALKALASRANAARVTVHPLDDGGLPTHSLADVTYSDRRYTPSSQTERIREANLRAGEWILAEETGGRPVLNANDPSGALGQLAQESAGGYALGFTPTRDPDGRSHQIRVEVRRKGLHVRHRRSYFHGATAEAVVDRALAALLFGLEEDTLRAVVDATLAPPSELTAAGRVANVRIKVPLASLAGTPGPDGPRAQLRIVMAVRNPGGSTGRPVNIREHWVEMALPSPAPDGGPDDARHEFMVEVTLAPEERDIAVLVQDVGSGRVTTRRVRPALSRSP